MRATLAVACAVLVVLAAVGRAQIVDKDMKKLSDMYYLAVQSALAGPNTDFQLFFTSLVPINSPAVWDFEDDVPPFATTQSLVTGLNRFSQQYHSMSSSLQGPSTAPVKQILDADEYANWEQCYQDELISSGDMLLGCKKCSAKYPTKYGSLLAFCNNIMTHYTVEAASAWNNPACYMTVGGKKFPSYSTTYDELKTLLAQGEGKTVKIDSTTSSSDMSNTWAKGAVSGFWDMFSAGASSSYSKFSQVLASSKVTMSVSFTKAVAVPVVPGCWFYGPELTNAYSTADFTVWIPNAKPDWDTLFKEPTGSLLRYSGMYYAVDGIEVTMTSNANIATTDRSEFKAAVDAGIWPFFSATGSGGTTHEVNFQQGAGLSITTKAVYGTPRIIGRSVLPIKGYAAVASAFKATALSARAPASLKAAAAKPVGDGDRLAALARDTDSDFLKYGLYKLKAERDERESFLRSVADPDTVRKAATAVAPAVTASSSGCGSSADVDAPCGSVGAPLVRNYICGKDTETGAWWCSDKKISGCDNHTTQAAWVAECFASHGVRPSDKVYCHDLPNKYSVCP